MCWKLMGSNNGRSFAVLRPKDQRFGSTSSRTWDAQVWQWWRFGERRENSSTSYHGWSILLIILILISIISCASLGCFLRKDLLEDLGAVLDFHGKKVQWKMLAPQTLDETFKNESWAFFDEPTTTTSWNMASTLSQSTMDWAWSSGSLWGTRLKVGWSFEWSSWDMRM